MTRTQCNIQKYITDLCKTNHSGASNQKLSKQKPLHHKKQFTRFKAKQKAVWTLEGKMSYQRIFTATNFKNKRMVIQPCDLSAWKLELRGLRTQDHHQIYRVQGQQRVHKTLTQEKN